MKKFILIFSFIVISDSYSQWEILNEGLRSSLNRIEFVNENTGWITGMRDLLKTTDGGEKWDNIELNEKWYLNFVDFFNDSTGWGVGSLEGETIIVKTTDKGYNWTIQKQTQDIWLNTIYIIDGKNVYAAGSKIYKTTNGGISWNDISPNIENQYYYSIWFSNPDTGLVTGSFYEDNSKGLFLRTTNGGNNWEQTTTDSFNFIDDLQFINDSAGYFLAFKDTVYLLCKTENLGKTWTTLIQNRYYINSYQVFDSTTIFASINNPGEFLLKKSTDGGKNWEDINIPFWIDKLYFNKPNTAFMIGGFGNGFGGPSLCKTTNGGYNWDIEFFSYPINDVYFINKNKGFLAGGIQGIHMENEGSILQTFNGGEKWEMGFSANGFRESNVFRSLTFFDDKTGLALTGGIFSRSIIYKTTNGGSIWYNISNVLQDTTILSLTGNDFFFSDENNGWIGGYYLDSSYTEISSIFRTTNGGINWETDWKDPSTGFAGIKSIYFNLTKGWAVGDKGLIVKYSQENGWEKITSGIDLPLNKVFAVKNSVWITGGFEPANSIIMRSTNYGESFTRYQTRSFIINDIYFTDNNSGLAVGYDSDHNGVILKSPDGGINWKVKADSILGALNSLFIKDNYGWAAGESGVVLRTSDHGLTWINDRETAYPEEFLLEQNYPNPFNPSTKIKYSIPIVETRHGVSLQHVMLKVYDVVGREVAVLVNEEKSAGNYEVIFNAGSFASGIYFYSLKAESLSGKKTIYSETKKMMLIK